MLRWQVGSTTCIVSAPFENRKSRGSSDSCHAEPVEEPALSEAEWDRVVGFWLCVAGLEKSAAPGRGFN